MSEYAERPSFPGAGAEGQNFVYKDEVCID